MAAKGVAVGEFHDAAGAAIRNGHCALASIDLDSFKAINDDFGYSAGDAVLRSVERTLVASLPEEVTLSRFGGDEFLVLFPGTPPEEALILLDELRDHLEARPPCEEVDRPVGFYAGLAGAPAHAATFKDLKHAADEALQRAKREGTPIAIYVEERMVLKSNYYPKGRLARLAKLSERLRRTEASLLREALDDVVEKYKAAIVDLDPGLPRIASGKVREIFDAGEHLLMVATDRISVFDVVLPTPVPDKGAVLTGLSAFWFDRTASLVPNHMVSWVRSGDWPEVVKGRGMLVRRAEMIPLECVVRGYLAGSGWKDYQRTGEVCGVKLPSGLLESSPLPEPIFTPSTKAATGHDENVDLDAAKSIVGDPALVDRIAKLSVDLYVAASEHARSCGIILADTKFEFGIVDGQLTLCDEAFTPDSSRYWPADQWQPGQSPPSFDKQYVRDHCDALGWDKTPPGPELPPDVVNGTSRRYRDAFERITGRSLDTALQA